MANLIRLEMIKKAAEKRFFVPQGCFTQSEHREEYQNLSLTEVFELLPYKVKKELIFKGES